MCVSVVALCVDAVLFTHDVWFLTATKGGPDRGAGFKLYLRSRPSPRHGTSRRQSRADGLASLARGSLDRLRRPSEVQSEPTTMNGVARLPRSVRAPGRGRALRHRRERRRQVRPFAAAPPSCLPVLRRHIPRGGPRLWLLCCRTTRATTSATSGGAGRGLTATRGSCGHRDSMAASWRQRTPSIRRLGRLRS
jgi:hypothetical protein